MNETKRRKEDSTKKGGAKERTRDKNNANVVTWAKAAISVLQRFDEPLSHKEILRIIQDEGLKGCGRGSMPLACLNSMLNSHSRGPNAIFYRAPGQQACFGLRKPKTGSTEELLSSLNQFSPLTDSSPDNSVDLTPTDDQCVRKSPLPAPKLTVQGLPHPSTPTNAPPKVAPAKLPHSNMTTRPRGSVTFGQSRPTKPGLSLSREPGAALRVMPPKKRPKLDEDDVLKDKEDNNTLVKTEDTLKATPARSSAQRRPEPAKLEAAVTSISCPVSAPLLTQSLQQPRRTRVPPASSNQPEGRQPSARIRHPPSNLKQSGKPQLRVLPPKKPSPPSTSHTNDSSDESTTSPQEEPKKTGAGFLEVKLKKLKKMSLAEQIKRLKEGKVDIVTADSILTSVNIKSLFSGKSFNQLPPAYQYQLMMLLPKVDHYNGSDSALRLSPSALNNEFFTQACQEWRDKLADGEFNVDIVQKIKQEEEGSLQPKLDPWKEKYFEPAWGKRTLDDESPSTQKLHSESPENSWSVFIKFAENPNGDFTKDFKKVQSRIKAFKSEKDKRLKPEDRKTDSLHASRKSGGRGPASPKAPKGQSKNEIVGKSRSKRALKRAQELQRKKVFEKQLQEAKAKIVQNARMEARKSSISGPTTGSPTSGEQIKAAPHEEGGESCAPAEIKVTPLVIKRSRFQESYHVIEKEEAESTRKNKPRKPVDCDVNGENECSTGDVKILREDAVKSAVSTAAGTTLNVRDVQSQESDIVANTKAAKGTVNRLSKSKRDSRRRALTASNSGGKFKTSRVICAPSIYARASNSSCPCSLAPMVICQKCGAFCHQDCINSNKICTLCIPA